uniref:Uncharacterized protein n=1 Tax=Siphoviridae sp. ctJyX12 TaxID=2827840 RepID=A0A8S5SQ36_9CAUD|nr:MAG TPA: hypothetical protein [Siphoviridae sp. ctJyX12]DAI00009.1 MAG TPA: hypothetical protein [Caudoviricetes sp.]DAK36388.1 MAG TPA: hypothetical protein [Caudoviricetes sp.]DAU39737.1 MAG TPA: hypothetical protein [Caudoviricetes sp.]DAX84862.1 MAG TPA: hypothetical protein [Caudoviricetes sp.]
MVPPAWCLASFRGPLGAGHVGGSAPTFHRLSFADSRPA